MSKQGDTTAQAFWGDDIDDSVALERYRTLVNTVDDGIYQLDAAGRFVAVNDIIVEMSGYTRDELLNEHVSLVLEDGDIGRISRKIAERVHSTERLAETFDIAVQTADGQNRYCELRVNLLIEDGTFQGTVGVVRDITDSKRTERTLEHREQDLERERDVINQVLETSPVGIVVLDADGEILRLNDRATDVLEIPAGEAEMYDPSSRPVYTESGDPIPADDHPFAQTLQTGEPVYDEVLQIELPDGTRRWLSVNAAPLFDESGEIDRVVTAGEDITHIKAREQELETELEEIFGRVSDAFYAVDDEFQFTHVNERAEELLQQSQDELIGKQLWDVFPSAAEIDDVWDAFQTALDDQEPTSYELYYETLDFWVEANLYPSETGISVYFRDVTERKHVNRHSNRPSAGIERSRSTSQTLVTLFDHDLEYTLAAGQGFDRIPVEPNDLEGQQFHDVWPDETAATSSPRSRRHSRAKRNRWNSSTPAESGYSTEFRSPTSAARSSRG